LTALTVNVYVVPAVNPVTVIGELVPVAVIPPGDDVTIYEVIGGTVGPAGGVNATVALVELTRVAVPIVGALGAEPEFPAAAIIKCVPIDIVLIP
jgi:hypothetical protein